MYVILVRAKSKPIMKSTNNTISVYTISVMYLLSNTNFCTILDVMMHGFNADFVISIILPSPARNRTPPASTLRFFS